MNIRNARALTDGRVDCEINHPQHGWIPHTASMDNPLIYGAALSMALGRPINELDSYDKIMAAIRSQMVCSPLQGRLALGEEACEILDQIASDPSTPWAMRQSITGATEWRRDSETITELAYIFGYDDNEVDALFKKAMTVKV